MELNRVIQRRAQDEMIEWIDSSRRRARESGLNSMKIPMFRSVMTQSELICKRLAYEEILSVIRFFIDKLLNQLQGTPIMIVISDEKGYMLELAGDETMKQTVTQLGIKEGVQFAEEECGTNGINLALNHRSPVQLIGTQHYHQFFHSKVCYSVPFHYTDINNLLGTISIMTSLEQAHPYFLTMLITVVDSIERELLLRRQNRKLNILNHIMMDTTRNGIIITDREGRIMEFNTYAENLTGLTKEQLIGRPVIDLAPMGPYIDKVIRHGDKHEDIEIVIDHLSGQTKCVCLFDALPILDEYDNPIGAFGQFRDITERYEAEERYNYLAYHDDLTGLPNRRHYNDHLNGLLTEAKKNKHMLAVLYLDLDRFKLVNDTLGHSKGDYLLQKVAERLRKCLLDETVTRMGGDEFSILLSNVRDSNDAVQAAQQVLQLFEQDFVIDHYQFRLSTSIGISIYPHDGLDAETLLTHADMAMYQAKAIGKNRYMVYTPSMVRQSHEKLTMETDLRKAVEHQELVLYYQPQVKIRTGEIVGMEALLRWKHPKNGLILPADFIPLAEETGIIVPIGEWVLHEVCRHMSDWEQSGLRPMKISVNLSPYQFLNSNCVDSVERVLKRTGINPRQLELEITESMTMDVEQATPIIHQLRNLGVQISIDDFGTSYSSLNYLKKFSVHRLKIDRSFVKDLASEEHNRQIVGTIITMAHKLGLEVVAEGVETAEQLSFLSEQRCDEAQGHLFSAPLPAHVIAEKLHGSWSKPLS
ncbi:EAL domain-containing protein [Paenibacillus apiarius]|uniref:EAL domain-containing protein n=1 Tax=Paenibacillus apiarius TaxID=46240 RepID=UPI003B3A0625